MARTGKLKRFSNVADKATTATQHDQSYSASFTARGNVTAVSRWDVTDIINGNKALTTGMSYDSAGSVLTSTDPLGHQSSVAYADSFSDLNNGRNTLAYPTAVTDPDGFSRTVQYNFDFGAKTRVQGPPPANQAQGLIQTFTYDNAARVERIATVNNGAYTRYVYGPNYVQSLSTVNTVADEAYNVQVFDGVGRIRAVGGNNPGSSGGYSGKFTTYDVMGRLAHWTNPAEINGDWAPVGDDNSGWILSFQTYDWKGRPLVTTNQDGTTREESYSGCGCAGGEVVTLTDEGTLVNGSTKKRQQRIYHDVLGRTVKAEVLNWDGAGPYGTGGSVYSTAVNIYNGRDQIKEVRQYPGSEGAGTPQVTTMTYDGHGRLKTRHVPEQEIGKATAWDYNPDDTIQKVTDARGSVSNFTYNARHLVTQITYDPSAGITDTPDVSFAYDGAGNRSSMTDGAGTVSYQYDELSQMTSESRTFTGLSGSYSLTYSYNLAGNLKSITDPTDAAINYAFDAAGRNTAVTGTSFGGVTQYVSNLQYRAWGAVKGTSYGNTKTLSTTYNSRLEPTHFEIPGVMVKDYQYQADGRLRYSANGMDNRFDRSYSYDHAGRVTEAFSGPLARGLTDTNDRPYKQLNQYDAMNNLVGRVGSKLWTSTLPGSLGTSTYTNNRNNSWQYDADGRLTSGGGIQNTLDAAGSVITSVSSAGNRTETQVFDGNAQPAKTVESVTEDDGFGNMITTTTTRYSVISTVLGALVTDLDEAGHKTRTLVYNGGQVLAWQEKAGGSESVLWEYRDPSNASYRTALSDGTIDNTRFAEMDPLGSNAGSHNPYFSPQQKWPKEDLTYPAFADMTSGDCRINGIPAPCSMRERLMDRGFLTMETGVTINGKAGPIKEWRDIISYGLGIYGIWLSDGARGNDGHVAVVLFAAPQNPYDPRVDFRDYAVQLSTNGDPNSCRKLALLAYKAGQVFTDPISGLMNGLTEIADVTQSSSDPNYRVGVMRGDSHFANGFGSGGFLTQFQDHTPGSQNQVRHFVGWFGAGAWLAPPAARRLLWDQEGTRNFNNPDVALGQQAINMGYEFSKTNDWKALAQGIWRDVCGGQGKLIP